MDATKQNVVYAIVAAHPDLSLKKRGDFYVYSTNGAQMSRNDVSCFFLALKGGEDSVKVLIFKFQLINFWYLSLSPSVKIIKKTTNSKQNRPVIRSNLFYFTISEIELIKSQNKLN